MSAAVYRDKRGNTLSTGVKPKCVDCGADNNLVFYNYEEPRCPDCLVKKHPHINPDFFKQRGKKNG